MSRALQDTAGHRVMFAMNNEGEEDVGLWGRNIANSWTVSKGIQNPSGSTW
jgi:hypothetical protein